ncbi:MAG: hypothetical protein LC624_04090, partial [Halobacteriales archaeon]|nr:hypothetical protein [Halobacteriales archaeon]
MAPPQHNRIEEAFGSGVAAVTRASARFPKTVLLIFFVVTILMAGGLAQIYVRSADYDLLPNDHPSTAANTRTLPEVPGFRSIESLYLEVANPSQNITGEAEIRAQDAVAHFIESRVSGIAYTYDLPYLVKFINYTASGIPSGCT